MRAGVAVIGGGAFGAWTAWHLRRAGVSVLLLDAYGPASGRASSGGESRIIRAAYGQAEIYSRWSARAMELWREWTRAAGPDLLHRTGALWISRPGDTFVPDSAAAMERCGLRFDTLSFAEIRTRFPQFSLPEDSWAI